VVGSAEDIIYNWKPANSDAVSTAPPDLQVIRQKVIDTLGSDRGQNSLWYKISAINYLQNISGPVQIDYGTADTVVPNAFSQHLDSVLNADGKAHETFAYPGEDHQFTEPTGRALFLQRSLAFLNKNLNQ
jgi:dipeptidyl aminopeptidase/acylaminoacyl peptidase